MNGFDYFGCDDVGFFDYGTLFQTAGGLTQGIVAQVEESQAREKLAADEKKKLDVATAADRDAAAAMARADVSAQLRSSGAAADAQAAQAAQAAQDQAGAALSLEGQQARAQAADTGLANATKNAKAKPQDGYLKALVRAWTTVVNKAHAGAIVSSDGGKKGKDKDQEPWLQRRALGPLPGAAVVVGGAGLLVVIGLVVKRLIGR